jgi:uncharacterized protein (TIGR02001 family)
MQKTLLALAATLTLGAMPMLAHAEDAVDPLSFNVSLVSDYRYRGISQTKKQPAIQGGADYAFANGFYVGTWASYIKWITDAGGSGNAEIDLYGGYKGTFSEGFGYDVGVLQYWYPGNHLSTNADTTEIYGALTYGPATLKYSHSVTNLFGFFDSKNSGYLDLSATFDVGSGYTVTPHVGHQRVAHNSDFSYTDYSLTANHDWYGLTFGASVVYADVKSGTYRAADGKELGKTTLVVSVKKVF